MRSVVYLYLAGMLALVACGPKYVDVTTDESQFRGYIPIEPIPVNTVRVFDTTCSGYVETCWASLSPREILALLPLQTAEVSVRQLDAQSSMKFIGSSASVEVGNYEVVMDYMKYLTDTVVTKDSVYIGSRKIGIGLRMTARVRTSKSDINISGLSALATQATLSHLSGSLSVNVIGIDSRDVTNLIPITSQLDQSSIEAALQALAAVKTKMWDTLETTITPHIVAVQQRVDSSLDQIIQEKSYKHQKSALGNCIREWWKPGGHVDTARTASLQAWLDANKSAGAPETITDLLSGAGLDAMRAKAVRDLAIPCDASSDTLHY
jgi:hypothetical protein